MLEFINAFGEIGGGENILDMSIFGFKKSDSKKDEQPLQSAIVEREIIHGQECVVIKVSIEKECISIWCTVSETNSDMIQYKSFRSKELSLGSDNFSYMPPLQSFVDNITFISSYLNKNGMTDENLAESLYLLCEKHITKNNRMIDNDLYGLVDEVAVLKLAIAVHYGNRPNKQVLEAMWLQLLQSCLQRIKDSVYITKYDLTNPLQPKPYLDKLKK